MELKGKPLTLGAKLVASAIVVVSLLMKAAGNAPFLEIDDAIKVASFVVLVFAPVDVSLWIQNAFSNRSGGTP